MSGTVTIITMTSRRFALAVLLLLVSAPLVAAQDVVFVVRHAERADAGMKQGTEDPPLSAEGQARAKRLASMLRSADIKQVFASQFKRTQETAQPLAAAEHLKITTVTAKDVDALVQQLSAASGASLVVGHSDTLPKILKALGAKDDVSISENEYDNLFVVVRAGGEMKLVKLRF
ncbi:MAG: phosphoglycerate mutase family protein [Acidobacteriota bacterium]